MRGEEETKRRGWGEKRGKVRGKVREKEKRGMGGVTEEGRHSPRKTHTHEHNWVILGISSRGKAMGKEEGDGGGGQGT